MRAAKTAHRHLFRRRAAAAAQTVLGTCFGAAALLCAPSQAALSIGNNPLYLVAGKANVLVVLDNSNSMDEAPNGEAVGSNSAASKSEIARGVVKNLTDAYVGRISMGLMAYKQNSPSSGYVHNSQYDMSYDPATYTAGFSGARASATKGRSVVNPSATGNSLYYNVALPFYDTSNNGNAFCYSTSANASNDFKDSNGNDTYRCFRAKTTTSNALPSWGNGTSEAAAGYSSYFGQYTFNPTDSDYAQGISDFGRFMTWTYVGPTWYRNDSPGRGYLHTPIADLGSTQAAAIKAKLACNVPGQPGSCAATGIMNAGLTPIEGTLLTARDYFGGSWRNTSEGYTSSCYPLPTSCGKDFVVLVTDGLPSTDKDGNALSNPTAAITAAANAAAALKAAGVQTYVIGFALPYGTDPTTLNQIAAAGGTTTAYSASSQASLQAAFDAIFDDIFRKTSAFGSVAQNSTAINNGSLVYQGRFDSTDWTGEVQALRPAADGTLTTVWTTSDSGRIPAAANRTVYTRLPGGTGVEFKLAANLAAAQQTALATGGCGGGVTGSACAQARIDWIRGDRSYESSTTSPMRKRSRVMGDVISSSPYYVKTTDTIFVGANDGMLHAIDASTGNERFAFIPGAVMSELYKLTTTGYTHQYYVDGDIAVSTTAQTAGKNILVGSLGRGGKSLYAIDVTDPTTFGAGNVMWEFSDADLGLVLGKPIIARLNNGKTAVLVGNGPNSTNERAVLFVIDIETGALLRKIDTGAGSSSASNGMATPRGWDLDGNGTTDVVYAGDLQGNVWKFDFASNATANWLSVYTSGGSPAPMFVALDAANNRQPITGMVGIGLDARKGDVNYGKRFVFVGTGRYLTTSDVTNALPQTWYGLVDDGAVITGRSVLKRRTIEVEATVAGGPVGAFSIATAGDMAGFRGWYVDLVSPVSGNQGERMIGEQKFFGTTLVATSIIPSSNQCVPGGTAYVNAVDPFTGAALATPFFDVNNDAAFDAGDSIGSTKRSIGRVDFGVNLASDAIIVGNGVTGGAIALVSGTNSGVAPKGVNWRPRTGRISWREVVNR